MTQPPVEDSREQARKLTIGGALCLLGPIVLAMILSAAEAPIDPKFTAPVFGAVMIAGAGMLGKARVVRKQAEQPPQ
ncbi:hypothetical protein [Glycomyces salinus]|uniref:hypothetical protein n=1 Tax=Glycomyces salinus TaxID=980294 RepID=UPI0018EC4D61|nr:hypothetical protein [Glycomyces salinus]